MSQSHKIPKYISDQEELTPQTTPEQDLWLAVLVHGIYSAMRKKNQEDMRWLTSKRTSPGSFLWICEHCNIDIEALHEKLHLLPLRPEIQQPQKFIQGFFHLNTRKHIPYIRTRPGFYKKDSNKKTG